MERKEPRRKVRGSFFIYILLTSHFILTRIRCFTCMPYFINDDNGSIDEKSRNINRGLLYNVCSIYSATNLLAPLQSLKISSFNYRSDLAFYTTSSWRVASMDPALALVVRMESIHLDVFDSLIIQTVHQVHNHSGNVWTIEGELDQEWKETADKVFKGGQVLVTFQSLGGQRGFELDIVSVPLEGKHYVFI